MELHHKTISDKVYLLFLSIPYSLALGFVIIGFQGVDG
jgi:hypothetical protein